MRFGVPDFKIEKTVVERRVQQLVAEGVELRLGVDVGVDVSAEELREQFDAVVLAIGSRVPRDLPVPGRELDGVHFAMEYLYVRNRWVAGSNDDLRSPAPRTRTSSSSAAATPAPTAWATRSARAPRRSSSSSCCPSRRPRAPTSARRGRCGR